MARKVDIGTAQVEFDFPQAAAPPKPKDGRNGLIGYATSHLVKEDPVVDLRH